MKLLKSYYVKPICCILMLSAFCGIVYFLRTLPEEAASATKILNIMIMFASAAIAGISINDYLTGIKYKKVEYVPTEDLEIDERKNIFIITLEDKSYAVPIQYRKYIEVDKIKRTIYYNRKKEELSEKLHIPYLTQ